MINQFFDKNKIQHFIEFYSKWGIYSVIIGGFTPIPFKIITITSGFLKFDFLVFILSAFFARGLRFFLVGLIIKVFADKGLVFLKKNKVLIFLILPLILLIIIQIVLYVVK